MDNDIDIVHRNPQSALLALDAPYTLAELFEDLLLYAVGNGSNLSGRIGVAYDKIGAYRTVKPAQVERYNILTLLVLNGFDNSFNQFFLHICNIKPCKDI